MVGRCRPHRAEFGQHDMFDTQQFYIGGQWVDPVGGASREVLDPSTDQPFATITMASHDDVDRAVAQAKAAFAPWSSTPGQDRLQVVEHILEIYKTRAGDLADAISMEMGAPKDFALERQVAAGAYHITNFIRAFQGFEFERRFSPDHDDIIMLHPIGVAGLITPWNWPMNQVTLKVIPALLAGCTVVLKPSEIAPISSMLFAEIIHKAGVPGGVFNLVNGDGINAGAHLSAHPDVSMISFTGSTKAGIAISRTASDTLKRVALELGGKGANIVFADADDGAVERGAQQCFANTGQSCDAPTRMLVQRAIYEHSIERAREVADAVRVDSAHKSGAHIGPLSSRPQLERVQRFIQAGLDEGARLVAGGLGMPEGMERGYFVRPTVFADVRSDMTIFREEIFGPVLSIIPFDDEDEAVAIANDSFYGLTNYVQSQDSHRRQRVARQLKSGMVVMNGRRRAPGSFFGGVKMSGRAREGGVFGIEEFLESKSVAGL